MGSGFDIDGESGLIATTDGDTYNYPAEVIEATPSRCAWNALMPMRRRRGGHGGGFGSVREFGVETKTGAFAGLESLRESPLGYGWGEGER